MRKLQEEVKYMILTHEDKDSSYYKQCVELRYNEFFVGFNRTRESVFDEFEDESVHIVAYIGDRVIGHARLFVKDYMGEISQVVIDKEFRGANIGVNMMTKLLEYSDDHKLKRTELDARIYAINFYRIVGFETYVEEFISKKTALPHIKMERFLKDNR